MFPLGLKETREGNLASNPGSPFRILSHSFGEKSERDKIWNREPAKGNPAA